jgi:hypothetical protein
MDTFTGKDARMPGRLRRLAPVVGLLLLVPIAAEYLSGYQVDDPLAMLAGLALLAPLYGTVAVLIREVTRRAGCGWPTILLLSAAFGLIQAGLIDQSLFNPGYLDGTDPTWAQAWREERQATLVPVLDLGVYQLLGFVGGHMVSFAAPIAVVEAVVPDRADRPWLRRVGMAVMAGLYLLAAYVFFTDHVTTHQFVAAAPQLIGTAAVVAALVVAAFTLPRRGASARAPSPRRVPRAWVVGLAAVSLLIVRDMTGPTWGGVAVAVAALGLLGGLLLAWSRRPGWGRAQVLTVAGAALVSRVVLSFMVVEPLGDASPVQRYGFNTVLLVGVAALLAWGWRRTHRAGPATQGGPGAGRDSDRGAALSS